VHFGHGRGCLGTANQQNGNSENKQSFHILHLRAKTLSLSRRDSLHSRLNWNCCDKRPQRQGQSSQTNTGGTDEKEQLMWIVHALMMFVVLGLGLSMVSYPPPSERR